MENQILRVIFAIFVGLMIAFFVGFGIDAFYPEPVYPQVINDLYSTATDKPISADVQAQINALEAAYQADQQMHNRVISIVVTIAAVLFLGVSLLFENKNRVMANGILLGGLFSLLYGTARGLGTQDSMVTFITVGVGLAAVVFIGLRRFNHAHDDADTDTKKPITKKSLAKKPAAKAPATKKAAAKKA